jgi:tetratricopeptide (TPR) repeat protein
MLRSWLDVIVKWRLLAEDFPGGDPEARRSAALGRCALLEGQLDTACDHFTRAARLRDNPLDQVGLGDVLLARGRFREADEHYRRALAAGGPASLLARLGTAQVMVGEGRAASAIADLENLVADRPQDRVLRYYLASAWCSVAEQCRSRTADDTLVITSERQLLICEQAARRILALDVGDEELARGAEQLLEEVTVGRRWTWVPEGIAVSLAVLSVALGLITVVAGGLIGNAALVVSGVLVGAALVFAIVFRFRRQTWRRRAAEMAGSIVRPGV